jgi:hypothetical protein
MTLVPPELQHPCGHVHRVLRARHPLALHRRVSGEDWEVVMSMIGIMGMMSMVSMMTGKGG